MIASFDINSKGLYEKLTMAFFAHEKLSKNWILVLPWALSFLIYSMPICLNPAQVLKPLI